MSDEDRTITTATIAEANGVTAQTVRNAARKVLPRFGKTNGKVCWRFAPDEAALLSDYFRRNAGKRRRSKSDDMAKREAKDTQSFPQSLRDDFAALRVENAKLEERCRGLERENELLRERLGEADAALKREQLQARGFWARLGQRLLGSGD